MPKRYRITLSEEQRAKLEAWRRNPPKPYLRRRARAILLVAAGETLSATAAHTYVRVDRSTVRDWVQRFLAEGPEGLKIRPGRGRKPAFSPSQRGGGAPRSPKRAGVTALQFRD